MSEKEQKVEEEEVEFEEGEEEKEGKKELKNYSVDRERLMWLPVIL